MNIDDLLFLSILIWMLIITIYIYFKIKNKLMEEHIMSEIERANKDRKSLEEIARTIETEYKPINIELTSYEQEQENNAIISYEELLSTKKEQTISYDENFENDTLIDIKKIDLKREVNKMEETSKIDCTLMNYEKEEAFLKALKQLQKNLAS